MYKFQIEQSAVMTGSFVFPDNRKWDTNIQFQRKNNNSCFRLTPSVLWLNFLCRQSMSLNSNLRIFTYTEPAERREYGNSAKNDECQGWI